MSKRKSKKIPAIAVMSTLAVTALASSVSADTIIRNSTLNGLQVSSGASNANINAQGKITSISGDVVIKAPTTLKADSDATNPFKDARVVIETNGTVTIEVPLKEVQINSNATIRLTPGKGSIERASVAPGKNPDLPPSVPGVGNAPNVSLSMETGKITKGKVKLVGTDSTMEYQIKAKGSDSWGTAWTSITGRDIELTASKDNVIRVRVKATTTTLASQARELTVRTENIGNPVVVNKKELNTKIGEANEKVKNKADYTPDSWQKANLESVIEAAKVVANKADATQTEVDAQVKAINEAIGKLVDKTIDTDQDAVNAEAAKIKSVAEP
ncbi:hypothetical protein, partial [Aneurinibacillus aneurinilyticus]|uniref:hypothetical protein n=1 Tax=Aneurinibacillus aneurinilyticus TaxID=1391 RepID=UPI0023F3C529